LSCPRFQHYAAGLIDKATQTRVLTLVTAGARDELRKESEAVMKLPGVYEAMSSAITQANRSRSTYSAGDRIHDLHLVLEPFSVENGMLTQTLKVKRNVVADIYTADILAMRRK
jgi:long-chain acyl-CoA synthetase